MLNRLVKTNEDYALTIARLVLGMLFFIHGDQLMLGWFGGYGLSGSMKFFTQGLGIPAPFAFLAICAQFFGCFCVGDGVMRRVGTRSGEHLTTFLCGRDRKPDQLFTFLV